MQVSTEIVGKGVQAIVYEIINHTTDDELVIKLPAYKNERHYTKMASEKVGPKVFDVKPKNCKHSDYIVMEKLTNAVTLYDIVIREGFNIGSNVIDKLMEKVDTLHKMKVLHNDLCAENVMLVFDDNYRFKDVKLIDFGRSKQIVGGDDKKKDFKKLYDSIRKVTYYYTGKELLLAELKKRF